MCSLQFYSKDRSLLPKVLYPQTSVLFIRHAQTPWNRDGLTMGQTDIALSDVGLSQAHDAAMLLGRHPIGHIVCSPLKRCIDTIEPFRFGQKIKFEIDEGWMERGWGIFEGQPKSARGDERAPTGGETASDFTSRIQGSVARLPANNLILVVSHSGVFRELRKMGYLSIDDYLTPPHAVPILLKRPTHISSAHAVSAAP